MTSNRISKKKLALILVAVLSASIIVACFAILVFGYKRNIATVDLGSEQSMQIWLESDSLSNWDPDHAGLDIYYEISESGRVIVPQTYLGTDHGYDYEIRIALTEDGALACVYDVNLWDFGVFIIFDAVSGESWPRLRDDEVSYDPEVQQKWRDRYRRLRLENPTLPEHWLLKSED